MARPRAGIVYVGLKAAVTALDRRTGEEVWSTQLKSGVGASSSFVTLQRDGDILYAGVAGEIWALDPKNGTVLWRNRLKGMGYGIVSILGDDDARAGSLLPAAVESKRLADAAAAAAAT